MHNMNDIEGDLLDYEEIQEKVFYILHNMTNVEERKRKLDELCSETSSYFRGNFENGSVQENQYWYHFFEVLSNVYLALAICYFDLKNVNKVIEYGSMSAQTTMVTGELYDKKIKNIGSLILAACVNEKMMLNSNPEEYFRRTRLKTISERFNHYYSAIAPN